MMALAHILKQGMIVMETLLDAKGVSLFLLQISQIIVCSVKKTFLENVILLLKLSIHVLVKT